MAEAVLSGLVTSILNSLAAEIAKPGGSSASQKIRLLCGAKDELQSLESTVQSIQAVLLDAEKQQWHNDQVKLWLKRLKAVLYDVEDLLDDVATEDLRRKVTSGDKIWKEVRIFFSKSNQLAHRLQVANKIEEVRKNLVRINNNRRQFELDPHLSGPTVAIERRRITHSFVREEEIIGREEDKKEIIAHLLDSSSGERVSVVSIVGIGGLGKTTLARLVYNDDKVKDCFKPKLWACHGDTKNFDEYVIIKDLLKSARGECQGDPEMMRDLQGIENTSNDQLQPLLRKVLDGKKYLLVLDDLWNEDRQAWLGLQSLLMGGSWGSKILVTTRNRSVVRATNAKSVVHDLLGLSEDKSWDLFKKTALVDGEETLNPSLKEKCRDMVKKCAGVPLAIRTIGSLLYTTEVNEWDGLIDGELSEIDKSESGIMEALKVSYDLLPSALKHCFAYCALFPKDHVFHKETMIQLWMAQGFIESNEDLEKAGDRYVSYLLRRSFLEVEEVDDYTNEVKMFKMHDLMHDLASKVAGDECKMINLNEGGIGRGTRHVSFAFQPSSLQNMTTRLEATNLRTFLTWTNMRTYGQEVSPIECEGIFTKIGRCRTLALANADFCIPSSLGSRLKHLRFLDVSRNLSIQSLPDSITDLLNLQTLKLSGCKNLTTLPKDLNKLVNLRFLDVSENTSIQSLPDSITDLLNLHTLKLSGCRSLKTLPKDLKKLVNLRHLLIAGCDSLTHMPCLSELPSLKELELFFLDELEFVQEIRDPQQSNTACPFFPSLETLRLRYCGKLKGWWGKRLLVGEEQNHGRYDSQSSFPKLLHVEIWNCDDLNSLPLLPSVIDLELHGSGLKVLEHQVVAVPNYSSEAALVSTSFPLLKKLSLIDMPALDHSMLETLLPFLRNLESMSIVYCSALRSLPRGMQYLSSLQHLFIANCKELDLSSHDDKHSTQWGSLANLRSLKFEGLPKLVALPEGIQHVTSLQSLSISWCRNLTSLPEWIGNFSLLQDLEIFDCPGIECMPDGMQNLTSLKRLTIRLCSVLEERCRREVGADWEKIKGIAHLLC